MIDNTEEERQEVNRRRSRKSMKKWRQNNPEKDRAINRQSRKRQRAANPKEYQAKVTERVRLWRLQNPEKAKAITQRASETRRLKRQLEKSQKQDYFNQLKKEEDNDDFILGNTEGGE